MGEWRKARCLTAWLLGGLNGKGWVLSTLYSVQPLYSHQARKIDPHDLNGQGKEGVATASLI